MGAFEHHSETLVGRVLRDTYRILSVLEKGGMGTVYRGEHQRLKRPVAIKVLAKHLTADPAALTRFQREADIVSQLHHPHIVHILDFDTTDNGDPYIVMELLSGESLARRMDRERIVALRDVVQIVAQTAGGLIVAHAAGIVHRDLKPDNVFLLDMQDNSVFVKLLDFGISKRAAAGARVTGEYDVLGTPDYMAPEQVINTANADHRADQWSLAAMTYEMLCGRIPFFGETVVKTLAKVVGEEPTSLTELAPGIPKDLAAVVARGLAKEPAKRFASIMEYADKLAEATGLSLGPKPAAWIGAHESVTSNTRPTPIAKADEQLVQSSLARKRARTARAPASRESESRLPIPTVPKSDSTPPSRAPTLGAPNPRLRTSDPPPALGAPESLRNSRRPQRARLRGAKPGDAGAGTPRARVSAPPQVDEPPAHSTAGTLISRGTPKPNSSPLSDAMIQLQAAMDEVRQAVTFGEEQRALSKARVVLQLAQADRSRETKDLLVNSGELLSPILLRSLGGLSRKVSLWQPQSASSASMSPEHVFLLSRIDGTTTVEELLDVSPLSTAETLGILIDFRDEGYLEID
jgi:serine/threonine-protein kinase